ncbi:sulfatase-like hydrolase/transferase [Amycolatopsis sp. FBCC-B4732]|uniref:sulfatase-like hydrolase/transferase n=1 Tax=Amycolatopsis sp. FBCC-B4732 TaxID=3079339 RepID=UPI0037C01EE7
MFHSRGDDKSTYATSMQQAGYRTGMIGTVPEALDKAGVRGNTELVFTWDNGYHMGEHRLTPGKQTAFDTDVHVPLVVTGPRWTPKASCRC